MQARRPEPPPAPAAPAADGPVVAAAAQPVAPPAPPVPVVRGLRASITDRNGATLAVSRPRAALIANPMIILDPDDSAKRIHAVLPRLPEAELKARLGSGKKYVYLARQITPAEQLAVNALGIPGIEFERTERRDYPMGRVAAHVIGRVNPDGAGIFGIEASMNDRLRDNAEPLRLSLDLPIQAVVREELSRAMDSFNAIGGAGIVMDVRTGEVIAMVSLPDFDARVATRLSFDEGLNRAVAGAYEPGSTFKLQTAAMAIDSGAGQPWNIYDASAPLPAGKGRFISDFEGKHRPLYMPEVIAFSSNIGAARIALAVGAERQRAWHQKMGMFARVPIELPEAVRPRFQSAAQWKEVATMTVGFGHGISVSPLHVVRATAAVANGGILVTPTLIARDPDAPPPAGERVMQQSTSDTMRKLMRLVVTEGVGKAAEVPGYFLGGKTGTAEKFDQNGKYKKNVNIVAFVGVFPMNAPRYAVYMMLDEPKANAQSHGYRTAGQIVAPATGKVVTRIGPMLGLLPENEAASAAIAAQLAMPLQPTRGAAPPVAAAPKPVVPKPAPPATSAIRPAPAPAKPATDFRNEAALSIPAGGQTVAAR
jgi:cell division protein FtsI (penicillin-binding protein 3)